MVVVKTVKEFFQQNHGQLKKFMQFKTGIHDVNLINDTVQEFYIRLIQTRALESYDPEEGSFETYIGNLFCWMLPYLSKRAFRYKHVAVPKNRVQFYDSESPNDRIFFDYRMVSFVQKMDDKMFGEEEDVFNHVHDLSPEFRASAAFNSSQFEDTSPEAVKYVEDFKRYIKRTESPKNAERMILFIEQKFEGCRSYQIADMLGVSCNMVKFIKHNLQKKYSKWQKAIAK